MKALKLWDAGFADIVGRKYGTQKLPYNRAKSVIGSIAFFVMASLASMGWVICHLAHFQHTSFVKLSSILLVMGQLLCLACTKWHGGWFCNGVQICCIFFSLRLFSSNSQHLPCNNWSVTCLRNCRVFATPTWRQLHCAVRSNCSWNVVATILSGTCFSTEFITYFCSAASSCSSSFLAQLRTSFHRTRTHKFEHERGLYLWSTSSVTTKLVKARVTFGCSFWTNLHLYKLCKLVFFKHFTFSFAHPLFIVS